MVNEELIQACKAGRIEEVKSLLTTGASPKERGGGYEGLTAMHAACLFGQHEIVQHLLVHTPDLVNVTNSLNETPIAHLFREMAGKPEGWPWQNAADAQKPLNILLEEANRFSKDRLVSQKYIRTAQILVQALMNQQAKRVTVIPAVSRADHPPSRRVRDDLEPVNIKHEPLRRPEESPAPEPVVKQTAPAPDPKAQAELKTALKKAALAGDAKTVSQLLARASHRPDNLEGLLYTMSLDGKANIVEALLSQNKFPFTQTEKDWAIARTCHSTTYSQPEEFSDRLGETAEVLLRHGACQSKETVTKLAAGFISTAQVRDHLTQHMNAKFPDDAVRANAPVKGTNDYAEGEKFLAYVTKWADKKFAGPLLPRGALKAKVIRQILEKLKEPAMKTAMGREKYTEAGLLDRSLDLTDLRIFDLTQQELDQFKGNTDFSLRKALNFHRSVRKANKSIDTHSHKLFSRETSDGLKGAVCSFLLSTGSRLLKDKKSAANTRKRSALNDLHALISPLTSSHCTLEKFCHLKVTVNGKEMNLLQVLMIHRDPKKKDSKKPTKAFKQFAKEFHLYDRFSPEEIQGMLDEKPVVAAQPAPQ